MDINYLKFECINFKCLNSNMQDHQCQKVKYICVIYQKIKLNNYSNVREQ